MNIFSLVIGAIGGAIISGITQFIIIERKAIHDRTHSILQYNHEKELQQEKEKQKQQKQLIYIKGKLLKIAYQLKIDFSLTKNYILEQEGTKEQEIHKQYLQQYNQISDALCECQIYFPEIIEHFQELSTIANRIWGDRQNYFGYSKYDEKTKNSLRIELIKEFNSVPVVIENIEYGLFSQI